MVSKILSCTRTINFSIVKKYERPFPACQNAKGRIYMLVLLFVSLSTATMSQQNSSADSLLAVLEKAPVELKDSILVKICEAYLHDDPEQSNRYAYRILTLSGNKKNTSEVADAYRFLGLNSSDIGSMDSVLYFYEQSMEVCRNINDSIRLAKVYSSIAGYYRKLSDYPTMLKYIITANEINEKIHNDYGVASTLVNIGITYIDMKQYDKALEYLLRAEKVNQKVRDKSIYSVLYNNLGSVYTRLNEEKKALGYLFKALEVNSDLGKQSLAAPLYNIGSVYYDFGRYDSAIHYMNQSLSISNRHEKDLASFTCKGLAEIYFKKKRYDIATDYAMRGAVLADSIGFRRGMMANYEILVDIFKSRQDYEKLSFFLEKLMAVKDSIFNEQKSKQIAELQTKYETARKEKEILALEKERREQALMNRLMIIIFSVSAIGVMLFFVWLRARMKQKQKLYKLDLELQQKKIENASLREAELKKEIDFKNKELASYTINFVQKSELMEELKRNLQSIRLENSEEAKKISTINKLVESSYHVDREWEDFKIQFENVHHNFFRALKERWPELTNSDLKLCALLKLNMNMKEAARVLGISPESVKTARYRLRKKFELSQDDNLVDFVLNLDAETKV